MAGGRVIGPLIGGTMFAVSPQLLGLVGAAIMIMAAVTFIVPRAPPRTLTGGVTVVTTPLRRSPRMPQSRVPGGKSHRVGLGHHQLGQ